MKKIFRSKTGIAIIVTALITTGIGLQQVLAYNGNSLSSGATVSETVYDDSGYMSGTGKISSIQEENVTYSFEIHNNDGRDNNKLVISWGKDKFYMNTLISQTYDKITKTITGSAAGRLNKDSGYTVEFTFIDAGKSGKNDWSGIVIKDASGAIMLEALGNLQSGNNQAR